MDFLRGHVLQCRVRKGRRRSFHERFVPGAGNESLAHSHHNDGDISAAGYVCRPLCHYFHPGPHLFSDRKETGFRSGMVRHPFCHQYADGLRHATLWLPAFLSKVGGARRNHYGRHLQIYFPIPRRFDNRNGPHYDFPSDCPVVAGDDDEDLPE